MAPSSLVPKLPLGDGTLTLSPALKSRKALVAQASRLCGLKRLAGDIRCAVRTLHGGHGGPPHGSSHDLRVSQGLMSAFSEKPQILLLADFFRGLIRDCPKNYG